MDNGLAKVSVLETLESHSFEKEVLENLEVPIESSKMQGSEALPSSHRVQDPKLELFIARH